MYRVALDESGGLLLTPRWHELPVPAQVALLALLCLVPLGLVLWLYRHETRLVSRRTAATLLALRAVVVLLILFLVGLEPVYARTVEQEIAGRVLVLIDRSDSMDVSDPQRSTADKLRLARALNLTGDEDVDDWIAAHDANRAIVWVRPDEAAGDQGRRRDLEARRRQAHDQICDKIDTLTRLQSVEGLLSGDGGRLLTRIESAKLSAELAGFALDVQEYDIGQRDALFKKATSEGKGAIRPTSGTDLALPLKFALERSGTGRGKV